MGFHDVTYPLEVAYGATSGIAHNTVVISLDSWQEQRIVRNNSFRKVFDARTGINTRDNAMVLRNFVAARRGDAHSFKVFDHIDNTTAVNGRDAPTNLDQSLGTGDGATVDFQLHKRYGDDNYGVYWNITKPDDGSVVVALDGANQTSGWSVDLTTGIITFDTAPLADVAVTAGCRYHVPCRFGSDVSEALEHELADVDITEVGSIPIIEDPLTANVADEYDYGGAQEVSLATTTVMNLLTRFTYLSGSNAGNAKLPPVAALEPGGPYLAFYNATGGTVTVVDDSDTTVGTIADATTATLWLALISGVKTWTLVKG